VTGCNFGVDWRLRLCDDQATLERRPGIGGTLGRRATTGPPERSPSTTSRFDWWEFRWSHRR
jgi:hypothetical protein